MGAAHILIAGCGDLGLRTAQRLLQRSDVARVYGLRRHPPGETPAVLGRSDEVDERDGGDSPNTPNTLADAYFTKWRWVAGDLSDPQSLTHLPSDITHVMFTPTPGDRSAVAYERVFLHGQKTLYAALAQSRSSGDAFKRWLFVSSSAVYGDHHGDWIDETTPTAPQGFNGEVLCAAEDWLAAHEGQACVLRLAGLYGPGRVQLLERLRAGRAHAPIDPPHMANRIHIEDAASACATLLMHPHPESVYLGADDHPQALHSLYAALAELLGAPRPTAGSPPANVGSKRMSNARLRSAGWTPRYPDAVTGYTAVIAHLDK
ncbi:MAG: NAD-dependent epimerase/dehydratase family protein [Burkholderiaceae bacterium]|nr:NAD-dependent epimerase/dehydratase family protein [Burkholderiaceae bacterium]